MKKISSCLVCSSEFSHYTDVSGKYCSRKCFYDGLKTGLTRFPGNKLAYLNTKTYPRRSKKRLFGVLCKNCEKTFFVGRRNYGLKTMCSRECRLAYLRGRTPWNKGIKFLGMENNPNWRGGTSKLPYHASFNKELKDAIRRRDNYQCQNKECNMKEDDHIHKYGAKLTVHHIDYNKMNCSENNLISCCKACNARFNFNREYWQKTLSTVMPVFLI